MWHRVRVANPVSEQTRRVVEAGIVRLVRAVVEDPVEVADVEETRDLLALAATEKTLGSLPGRGVVQAAASLTTSRLVLKSARMARFLPTARAIAVATGAVQAAGEIRRGLRELEVIASVLVTRTRAAGAAPDPLLVARTSVAIALQPLEPERVSGSLQVLVPKLVSRWMLRSVRAERASSRRRRIERWADAAWRVPLPVAARATLPPPLPSAPLPPAPLPPAPLPQRAAGPAGSLNPGPPDPGVPRSVRRDR